MHRRSSPNQSQNEDDPGYKFVSSQDFDYNDDPRPRYTRTIDPYADNTSSFVAESGVDDGAARSPSSSYAYSYNAQKFGRFDRSRSPGRREPDNVRREEDTRPIPEPIPTAPTPEYISISKTPSQPIENPMSSRKLLILDLNGTLLFRAKYRPPHTTSRWQRGSQRPPPFDPYADPTVQRPLRTVFPRPYMTSFREFLFHPRTRSWLDTMVWSSAQPHSVTDMVDKCFEASKEQLVAVWARDTLGLDERSYHQKTQTTKDLAKPWRTLPSISPGADKDAPNATSSPTAHSAHTTLLIDDSPLKAHLQPWNHVCVPEYISEIRQLDLETLRSEQTSSPQSSASSTQETSDLVAASEVGEVLDRKRKREEKKQRKKDEKRMKKESVQCEYEYDETLLAIIGILDTIKTQGNIAGWIRADGLWAQSREVELAESAEAVDVVEALEAVEPTSKEGAEEEGSGCESDMSISSKSTSGTPSKRLSASDSPPRPSSSASDRALYSPTPKESPDGKTSEVKVVFDAPVPSSSPRSSTLPACKVDAPAQKSTDIPKGEEEEQKWFESEAAMAIWVSRGRSALSALDIPAVSGVLT